MLAYLFHTGGARSVDSQDDRNPALLGSYEREPSDGLEPSTPSLPWNVSGNRRQHAATRSACFRPFGCRRICHRLPPVATALLHTRSIPCCPVWLRPALEALSSRHGGRCLCPPGRWGGG